MSTTISGTNGVTFPDSTSMQTGQQACKAWVNFNGTGTVAIRAQYNVSSITDNGTGDYTVNFTTAMPDANYSFTALVIIPNLNYARVVGLKNLTTPTTSGFTLVTGYGNFSNPYPEDLSWVNVAIFSN